MVILITTIIRIFPEDGLRTVKKKGCVIKLQIAAIVT